MITKRTSAIKRKEMVLQRGLDSSPKCKKNISPTRACMMANVKIVQVKRGPDSSCLVTKRYIAETSKRDNMNPKTGGFKLVLHP